MTDPAPHHPQVDLLTAQACAKVGAMKTTLPTITEAIDYAVDLPADCHADRCIIVLAAEVHRLRAQASWAHTCIHHTDYERKATPLCPVCIRIELERELSKARTANKSLSGSGMYWKDEWNRQTAERDALKSELERRRAATNRIRDEMEQQAARANAAEAERDRWQACAERLGAIVAADASQHDLADDIEPALAELARLREGKT